MSGGERARLARTVYQTAKRPLFCSPYRLAVGLGLQLYPISADTPMPSSRARRCVYYEWHADAGETHLGVYHGIARELLDSMGRDCCDIAACLFTAELAMPEYIARTTMFRDAARLQPHVPEWWLRARYMGFHRSGVMPRAAL